MNVTHGKANPIGATVENGGVNFCVYSKHATGMELVLFPSAENEKMRTISLDPRGNRTSCYWHVFVPGIRHGQEYGFRAHGPIKPDEGLRFDAEKLLLDPYTRAVTGWQTYDREAAAEKGDNTACALRSVVVDTSGYDWQGDRPPHIPYADTVIYEMHVGGFTRNPNSLVSPEKRGTFAGLIEKIPYLKDLGVTAVELMPVHEFDPLAAQEGMSNYWGYNTIAFLATHHGYAVGGSAVSAIDEFRDMVKALHKAGIEVILDVVFNHTGEGGDGGPTLSFRGLDNPIYYILEREDRSRYANYSGCGNSFNVNHPVPGRLVLDCLRYWVAEMHVDGFRFDLAAALTRDVFGNPVKHPALLWSIESDPILAGTKLIAEAWDAAGLYSVGNFITTSQRYAEWNGPFRDDVRGFIRGDADRVSRLASRVSGSWDIYVRQERELNRGINFITCHDGFTLNDLVSYNSKHNESNGENNRDGADANFSWNCGSEGATDDKEIKALRLQQMKNLLAVLFLSQGTPMILMGDEIGRTQHGNNNAYCHDSELTWFDWSLVEHNRELFDFVKKMIEFTQSMQIFRQNTVYGLESNQCLSMAWHGVELSQPDWGRNSHTIALTLECADERLHVMFNAYWEGLDFSLPETMPGTVWKRIFDTSLPAPLDLNDENECPTVGAQSYRLSARSTVVLQCVSEEVEPTMTKQKKQGRAKELQVTG